VGFPNLAAAGAITRRPLIAHEAAVNRDSQEDTIMRDLISLSCDTCKARNYTTTKNKKTQTDKFSIKKFCPKCRSHTLHKEGKIS
jgi:large subunit ribosomal protein L33